MKITIVLSILLLTSIFTYSQSKKVKSTSIKDVLTMGDLTTLIRINDEGAIDTYLNENGFEFTNNENIDSITYLANYKAKHNLSQSVKIAYKNNIRMYIELITDKFTDYTEAYNYLKTHNYQFKDKSLKNDITWLSYNNSVFEVTLGKGLLTEKTLYDISIEYRRYK